MRVARKSHSAQEAMSRLTAEKSDGRPGAEAATEGTLEEVREGVARGRAGATATTGDLRSSGTGKAWGAAFFTRFLITVVVSPSRKSGSRHDWLVCNQTVMFRTYRDGAETARNRCDTAEYWGSVT